MDPPPKIEPHRDHRALFFSAALISPTIVPRVRRDVLFLPDPATEDDPTISGALFEAIDALRAAGYSGRVVLDLGER